MVEVTEPNRQFKASMGVELREDRVKYLKPSLFAEVSRKLGVIEKDGKNKNEGN